MPPKRLTSRPQSHVSIPPSRSVSRETLLGALLTFLLAAQAHPAADDPNAVPQVVEVRRIWDAAPHCAFTDLIRFRDRWFCTFRESDAHVYGRDGQIRVITSEDGTTWQSAALIAEAGIDLRDPKISITPDGRLMLLIGGSQYKGRTLITRQPRVAFSADGRQWTDLKPILSDGHWLWRLTWHQGKAWGVSYADAPGGGSRLELYTTTDGLQYQLVTVLNVPGEANETTLRFLPDNTIVALVRRDGSDACAYIGTSRPPYMDWSWRQTGIRIGGPNFLVLPDGSLWAAGRHYPNGPTTILARMDLAGLEPVLTLPSGGDTSYPGLVFHEGLLWLSYYSSHEKGTAIYLAKLRLPSR